VSTINIVIVYLRSLDDMFIFTCLSHYKPIGPCNMMGFCAGIILFDILPHMDSMLNLRGSLSNVK
jgi:hypothetical protein